MEVHPFLDAQGRYIGGVAHRIVINDARFTVWFDAQGRLQCAERTLANGGRRSINNGARQPKLWARLQSRARNAWAYQRDRLGLNYAYAIAGCLRPVEGGAE
jgi:hypothetical protein